MNLFYILVSSILQLMYFVYFCVFNVTVFHCLAYSYLQMYLKMYLQMRLMYFVIFYRICLCKLLLRIINYHIYDKFIHFVNSYYHTAIRLCCLMLFRSFSGRLKERENRIHVYNKCF